MPHVCVRRSAAGHLVARNSSIRRKHRLADTKSDSWMTLDKSTGLALKKAVAPGSDWLLYRALGETSRLLLPVWVARAPRRCRLGELFQRSDVPVIAYPIWQFSNLHWALLEFDISASCVGSTSCSKGSVPPAFRHDVRHGFLRNHAQAAEVRSPLSPTVPVLSSHREGGGKNWYIKNTGTDSKPVLTDTTEH